MTWANTNVLVVSFYVTPQAMPQGDQMPALIQLHGRQPNTAVAAFEVRDATPVFKTAHMSAQRRLSLVGAGSGRGCATTGAPASPVRVTIGGESVSSLEAAPMAAKRAASCARSMNTDPDADLMA
jgi:hypothetical protein